MFLLSFIFLRTHTACCKYEDSLPHLPLSAAAYGKGGTKKVWGSSLEECYTHQTTHYEKYSKLNPMSNKMGLQEKY